MGCISYYSYIKPQPVTLATSKACVVYHTIPTSNHTIITDVFGQTPLYIILFLHQTTTYIRIDRNDARLYIILFLHQTTTPARCDAQFVRLYIILFLHQTTTRSALLPSIFALYIILFLHQTTTYNVDIADKQHVTITFINKK